MIKMKQQMQNYGIHGMEFGPVCTPVCLAL